MTDEQIKIYDATTVLVQAMNAAGLAYETRPEHTYVDFAKRGYARFAVRVKGSGVIVALELHGAGAKVRRRTIDIGVKGFPANVIKAIRKVGGGVQ